MLSAKPHLEMIRIDLGKGWSPLPGFPSGIDVKVLSDNLNQQDKTGARTRLVRFAANINTADVLTHDYWEEIYLLSGDLSQLSDLDDRQGAKYSCRPPGTPHGPFKSQHGCVLLEMQYYLQTSPISGCAPL